MAHGRPCGVGVATKLLNDNTTNNSKYVVTALDNSPVNSLWINESGNGFDNMTNTDYPTINYSISCTTMPFDDFDYITSASERNMGESYTCIGNGGGPAYLGNTRSGWVSYSYLLFEQFINEIKDSSFFNLGIAEALSKKNFGNSQWYNRQQNFCHNLLGCPETELWTATPTTFSSAFVTPSGTSLIVNAGVSGSTICVMSALDNGSSYYVSKNDVSTWTFPNISSIPYYYVTIDKQNKIPYISNPTTVLIENKTFSSLTYLNCQTVSAGYSVNPNTTDGNVVIANGANVIFDATGDILLDSGFEVQLGATFEAK